ncbi:MAG: bilirubin oxidase [Kiritimatiellaeota bacterium]|nr:bilirubin oxidase [Kiritimatiellota bacterium]
MKQEHTWQQLKVGAMILGLIAGTALRAPAQTLLGGTLDPSNVVKYVTPLVLPPAMPTTTANYYEIAARQFTQQILPTNFPKSTVWGYGSRTTPGTFNYPAFTIEAKVDQPVQVKWINDLVDTNGNYLPHLFAVDPTLHWANPGGPRDSHGVFSNAVTPYTGPVPIVPHVHGSHATPESDGYPEAWWLPAARNIPSGYFTKGTYYGQANTNNTEPGTAVFKYNNDQRAATVWYHDHALGLTRINVYAGLEGFYLLRGGADTNIEAQLPGPSPKLGDAPGTKYYEIPLAIQDRSFNSDGSLFFPDSRAFFDGFAGPYNPMSDIAPFYNPEFFGNMMVVNGNTWPVQNVEPRRYRFRMLNGCNARTVMLKLVTDPLAARPATAALPFWQIGNDSGFMPAATNLTLLRMASGERADVVVDFSGLPAGTSLYLINEGPDAPYGGGAAVTDYPVADPFTTGQIMKFAVVPLASVDNSTPPTSLAFSGPPALGASVRTRLLSLNELDSMMLTNPMVGPAMTLLGTVDTNGVSTPKMWSDPITERPMLGDTETWEVYNYTVDGHPVHLH